MVRERWLGGLLYNKTREENSGRSGLGRVGMGIRDGRLGTVVR